MPAVAARFGRRRCLQLCFASIEHIDATSHKPSFGRSTADEPTASVHDVRSRRCFGRPQTGRSISRSSCFGSAERDGASSLAADRCRVIRRAVDTISRSARSNRPPPRGDIFVSNEIHDPRISNGQTTWFVRERRWARPGDYLHRFTTGSLRD